MRFSFAPWNYRHLLGNQSPLFEKIVSRKIKRLNTPSLNKFEAYAYLKKELIPDWVERPELYGLADGTGTANTQNTACYKAISEAIERWAFYTIAKNENFESFHFRTEPTTTGMAAFPSINKNLGTKIARELARYEAMERWSICAWWEGLIPSRSTKRENSVELLTPWVLLNKKAPKVVIQWKIFPELDDSMVVAFACDKNIDLALEHSEDEMQRNYSAILRIKDINISNTPLGTFEKRLKHFSFGSGKKNFSSTILRSNQMPVPNEKQIFELIPKVFVDQEIKGPWNKYASVWRYLFKMPSDSHLSESENYFFF